MVQHPIILHLFLIIVGEVLRTTQAIYELWLLSIQKDCSNRLIVLPAIWDWGRDVRHAFAALNPASSKNGNVELKASMLERIRRGEQAMSSGRGKDRTFRSPSPSRTLPDVKTQNHASEPASSEASSSAPAAQGSSSSIFSTASERIKVAHAAHTFLRQLPYRSLPSHLPHPLQDALNASAKRQCQHAEKLSLVNPWPFIKAATTHAMLLFFQGGNVAAEDVLHSINVLVHKINSVELTNQVEPSLLLHSGLILKEKGLLVEAQRRLQPMVPYMSDSDDEIFMDGCSLLVDVLLELKQYTKVWGCGVLFSVNQTIVISLLAF